MIEADRARVVVLKPKTVMSIEEALVHAAWLVAVCMREQDFLDVLHIIKAK